MATRKPDVRGSARALARLGASRGGEARAAVLTAEERREIARKAVLARWKRQKGDEYQPEPRAAVAPRIPAVAPRRHSLEAGPGVSVLRGRLRLGELQLECHMLGDGTRVFEVPKPAASAKAARSRGLLAEFLARVPIQGEAAPARPISFRAPGSDKPIAGLDAMVLVDVSEAYLDARDRKQLSAAEQGLAKQADQLVRACARGGILALFDGATGYREFRARQALRHRLLAYISHDLQGWTRMFPEEFWMELSRLEGIRHRQSNRPIRWGRYVMFFLHDAIGKEVEGQPNAGDPDAHRGIDYQQWLDDFVRDSLGPYMQRVVTSMKSCKNLEEFTARFARVFSSAAAQAAFDDLPQPRG